MPSLTRCDPREKSLSFLRTRLASYTEAFGLRIANEFTHRTRFLRASRVMMCFLLRGSPSQSLLKHTMSWSSIMSGIVHGRYQRPLSKPAVAAHGTSMPPVGSRLHHTRT